MIFIKQKKIIITSLFFVFLAGVILNFFYVYEKKSGSEDQEKNMSTISQDEKYLKRSDENIFGNYKGDVSIDGDIRIAADTGQLLYRESSSDLVVFDPFTKSRKVLFVSADANGYDISRDGKMIVYAQKNNLSENPFESSIHVYNLESSEDRVLKNKSEKFAINPVFFPDNKRIAYVQRTLFEDADTPSDGEIWIRDLNTDQEYQILGDNHKQFIDISKLQKNISDETGVWDGTFMCINNNEIIQPKIGIQSIIDEDILEYTRMEWMPECSGLGNKNYYAHANGKDFFTKKYERSAIFKLDYMNDGKPQDFSWNTYRVSILSDKQFIAQQGTDAPLGHMKAALYDKNQDEKFVFYDSTKDADIQNIPNILDIKPVEGNSFLMAYQAGVSLDVFLKKIDLTESLDSRNFSQSDFFMPIPEGDNIHDVKIINKDLLLYRKWVDGEDRVFIYNLVTGQMDDLH